MKQPRIFKYSAVFPKLAIQLVAIYQIITWL